MSATATSAPSPDERHRTRQDKTASVEDRVLFAVAQVVGAFLILAPFVFSLLSRLAQKSWTYLIPNAVGSGLLTASAIADRQWGFILLEGTWFIASTYSIVRKAAGEPVGTP